MAKVSILVPAFRPDYLDVCLASALAQRFGDLEVIVSDDSEGDDVERIVTRWSDPRLCYLRNPRRQQPGANRDHLIGQASGKYLKFLFDDDFLLPTSVELLVAAAEQLGAKLSFHGRYVVDASGRQVDTATAVAPGEVEMFPPEAVFDRLVSRGFNFIGEPSNVLIEADALRSIRRPFGIDGERTRFLGDAALYVNLAAHGHTIVGIGHLGSAFRRHGSQSSGGNSPLFSAGLFEWELLARWSADGGHLGREATLRALDTAHLSYQPHVARYPELAAFLGLGNEPDAEGRYLSQAFRLVLEFARQRVDARGRVGASAA